MKPPLFRFLAPLLLASGLILASSPPAGAGSRSGRGVTYDGSAWLGVSVEDLSAKEADRRGLPVGLAGALISLVHPGSPAERCGLLAGDVILQVNDEPIAGAANLIGTISTMPVDTLVAIQVRRGSENLKITARLALKPTELSHGPAAPARGLPFGGADVLDASELDLLFPPGWERGLDSDTVAELRKLLEEMRGVLRGTRITFKVRASGLKDPFAGEGRRPAPSEDRAPAPAPPSGRPATDTGDEGDFIDPWDPRPAPKPKAPARARAPKPKVTKGKVAPKPAKEPKRLPEVEVGPSPAESPTAPPPPAPRRARPGS